MTDPTARQDGVPDPADTALPREGRRSFALPGELRDRAAGAWRSRHAVERRHFVMVGSVFVALFIAWVFVARASDAARANDLAAALRVQNAALREQVEAGRREVALIQSDAFLQIQARGYGMGQGGRAGERAFGLAPDAPPAPRITPLGDPVEARTRTPLEDWLDLLFGS